MSGSVCARESPTSSWKCVEFWKLRADDFCGVGPRGFTRRVSKQCSLGVGCVVLGTLAPSVPETCSKWEDDRAVLSRSCPPCRRLWNPLPVQGKVAVTS